MSEVERQETPTQRLDRNMDELMGELRVVVTGVQVLFAFLLVVPFDARFKTIDSFARTVYFVTLLLAAAATALVIAPSAQHRVLFRQGEKRELVHASQRLTLTGLVVIAAAIAGALMLVSSLLYGHSAAFAMLAGSLLAFGGLWFAFPLRIRRRSERRQAAERSAAPR